LAEQVCRDGKVDTIFVPLRQVAQGQLLTHAITIAMRNGRLEEVWKAIERTFEKTAMKEFVSVLTGIKGG
jgi:hypothetical protein